MGIKFQQKYKVPYYETEISGKMKLPTIFNVALQVSGEQSTVLERSDEYVKSLGLTWIVTEYLVELTRLPSFNEEIIIETEATSYNKFFCYRRFTFKDEKGDILLTIDSTWCLINTETRKPAHVPDEIVAPYESEKVRTIKRTEKIPALENYRHKTYQVRYLDLDINQHVNNSKYLDWMFDSLDYDFLATHQVETLHLKYVKEVYYGTNIESRNKKDGLKTWHEIFSNELNAQAVIEWRKNEI